MLLADLSRSVINNREQTLDTMVKEESQSLEDVEEGEISDSASIEEITEEDFNKQEPTKVSSSDLDSNLNLNSNSNSKQRVWTMEDLYKYSVSRNYASGLYNFAWAQAVQNKPLDEVMMMEFKTNDNSNLKLSSSSSPVNSREDSKNNSSIKETNQLAIEGSVDETEDVKMDVESEKEEGELEEGEIDMDPEVPMGTEEEEEGKPENKDLDASRTDTYGKEELEKRINSIREALKTVTLEEGEK